MLYLSLAALCLDALVAVAVSPTNTAIEVHLATDRQELVVREPMVFRITLRNVSDETVSVPDVTTFDNNMEHFLLEVEGPDGATLLRRNTFYTETKVYNPEYEGEPLMPGESITTNIYPVVSDIVQAASGTPKRSFGLTFPMAGDYRVRVFYEVDERNPRFWHSDAGAVGSNTVEIAVLAPTSEDVAILDAIWSKGPGPLAIGDDYFGYRFDEEELRNVVDMYPDNRLSLLAKFYLAKSLATVRPGEAEEPAHREAVELFNELRTSSPLFRTREVALNLAGDLVKLGEYVRASKVIEAYLRDAPSGESDYKLMSLRVAVDGDPHTTVEEWLRRRRIETPREPRK